MCQYGILKPVEVILRRGRRKKQNNELNRFIVYIYGNVSTKPPVQLLYTNKNDFTKRKT
jgi:hypothetical protein